MVCLQTALLSLLQGGKPLEEVAHELSSWGPSLTEHMQTVPSVPCVFYFVGKCLNHS